MRKRKKLDFLNCKPKDDFLRSKPYDSKTCAHKLIIEPRKERKNVERPSQHFLLNLISSFLTKL